MGKGWEACVDLVGSQVTQSQASSVGPLGLVQTELTSPAQPEPKTELGPPFWGVYGPSDFVSPLTANLSSPGPAFCFG